MINIKVDQSRVTVDDLIALESDNKTMRFMRDFLARFVVDEAGVFVEFEAAKKMVGALNIQEMTATCNQFAAAMRDVSVNPTNAAN